MFDAKIIDGKSEKNKIKALKVLKIASGFFSHKIDCDQ